MRARAFLGTLLLMVLALCANSLFSQTPQGFNYQAVIRNGSGTPITNQNISLQVTLQRASGTICYTEQKSITSNNQGVVAYTVGSGTPTYGVFDTIPWHYGDFYIKVEIDPTGGTSYTQMGDPTIIESVPYALYAENTKEVVSQPNATDDDPIFVVRNKEGQIVFAVYQTGVRVYVEDSQIKGVRGGFAIGGLTNQSKGQQEYFRITPDSARIYVKENPTTKGVRGGFAIGGLTNQSKQVTSRNLMFIAPDSARFYVKDSTTQKGVRGGFAIGGLTNQSKSSSNQFLNLTSKNYFIGHESGKVNTSGEFNSFLGYQTGIANTKGSSNSLMGYQAGYSNTEGSGNLLLGYQSGYSNTTGNYNSFLGYLTGNKNTSGEENTFVGSYSGSNNISGGNNTFLGFNAGLSNSNGASNIFVGTNSGYTNSSGGNNIFIGPLSGYLNSSGNYNTFIGYKAGYSNTTNFNVFMGYESGLSNTSGNPNVFIGYQAGHSNSTGTNNIFMGNQAGFSNSTGYDNIFLGNNAGYNSIDAYNNVCIGNLSGNEITHAFRNVYIGYYAGRKTLSSEANVFIGTGAGEFNTTGYINVLLGAYAGRNSNGIQNVMIGHDAGYNNSTGIYNIFLGASTGFNNNGSSNIFIGTQAGQNATGGSNIFIGHYAGMNETGSNKLYIDNSSLSTPLIYGDFSSDYLQFNGSVYIVGSANINKTWIGDQYIEINAAGTGNRPSYVDFHGDDTYSDFGFRIIRYNEGPNAHSYIVHRGIGEFNIQAQDAGIITISTNATERLRITAGGLIGVGRTPSSNAFEVEGNASKTSGGSWATNSDKRIKTDIKEIENAYETILQLHPVTFRYTDEYRKKHPSVEDKFYYNFVAQEYQNVFPQSVKGSGEFLESDPNEILQVDSYNAQIVTVKAVQELIIENKKQKEEIDALKAELEAIKKLITK